MFEGLAPDIPLEHVKWRQQGNPSRGEYQHVPYIDARHVAETLDRWVGPMNWSVSYGSPENWKGNNPVLWCHISVRNPETMEWVIKSDVGTESNFESEKGLVSDAFKRAAVAWGVGRNVYGLGTVWAKSVTEATKKAALMFGTPEPHQGQEEGQPDESQHGAAPVPEPVPDPDPDPEPQPEPVEGRAGLITDAQFETIKKLSERAKEVTSDDWERTREKILERCGVETVNWSHTTEEEAEKVKAAFYEFIDEEPF
jgi:hypothetical protein